MSIRILIASDLRLQRDALAEVLKSYVELQVIGLCCSRRDVTTATAALLPDVLLFDRGMPDSLLAVRELGVAAPSVTTIAFAVQETEHAVLACADAGVDGYVPRDATADDLVSGIHRAVRGEPFCSLAVAAILLRCLGSRKGVERATTLQQPGLTVREAQIARLLDLGLSNKDIARQLGIEVATAKNHVHNLLEKLKVHRRGEAAALLRGYAVGAGASLNFPVRSAG